MSAEDNILYNAQYYLHFLAMNRDISAVAAAAADDDDDDSGGDDNVNEVIGDEDDDGDCKHFISLHKLLTFSRLQEACEGDISILR